MCGTSPPDVTRLLLAWSDRDETALQRLMPLVYSELRRLAERYMGRERAGHTLQTTALINEAYLRLVGARDVHWQNRAHFYAVSAGAMRRILVDFARASNNLKRGGGARPVPFDEQVLAGVTRSADLLALDEALERLAALCIPRAPGAGGSCVAAPSTVRPRPKSAVQIAGAINVRKRRLSALE